MGRVDGSGDGAVAEAAGLTFAFMGLAELAVVLLEPLCVSHGSVVANRRQETAFDAMPSHSSVSPNDIRTV